MAAGPMFFRESPIAGDLFALAFSTFFALSLLRIFEETARRGVFDQKLNRKLVHITIGLAFMLCWPLFSSGSRGAVIAAVVPGINAVKVLLIGLGIMKDEATVKSMTRFGDHRSLNYLTYCIYGLILVVSMETATLLFGVQVTFAYILYILPRPHLRWDIWSTVFVWFGLV